MIVRERAIGPCGGRSAKRDDNKKYIFCIISWISNKKMAAKFGFSGIGDRDILREAKKYTFGKSIFKTFFKNRNSEILPPFLSTLDS